jgi:4-hydroxythreonine-4-phosphate dehydrogenase
VLPRLAVTTGDPFGIGPEVLAAALRDQRVRDAARWVVVGSPIPGAPAQVEITVSNLLPPPTPGPTAAGGELSFRAVEHAIRLCTLPTSDPDRCNGLVTAPISKQAWALAGHTAYHGHTELLAERFHAPRSAMYFHGPALKVVLVTVHIPLAQVPRALTTDGVLAAVELGRDACVALGVPHPRVAVCGLNPHAGEHGVLGAEDDAVIAPAIARARERGIDASGPFPGDAIFLAAAAPPAGKGLYDLVVAMYHDQGLIPVKLLDRSRTVNVTVGIPSVRTSPAHGTAYDIAGKGVADPTSMIEAMLLAAHMARARFNTPASLSS